MWRLVHFLLPVTASVQTLQWKVVVRTLGEGFGILRAGFEV